MQQTEASRFLEREGETPWSWEDANCLTLLGDWIDEKRGTTIGADWRRRALDEAAARAMIAAGGGMLAFLNTEAAAAGLKPIPPSEARDGDIGLVTVSTVEDGGIVTFEIGALKCGDYWGARTMSGFMAARCEASAAWRV